MTILRRLQSLLTAIGQFIQHPVLLVIRLYWGYEFFLTGRGKLQNLDKTTAFFHSLGIPMPHLNAIMAASTEMVGGLLLIAGLFSRFASFALIVVMCTALWTADRAAVNAIFSDTDKFLGADPFLFLYASVVVFSFGPGMISADALLFREKKS